MASHPTEKQNAFGKAAAAWRQAIATWGRILSRAKPIFTHAANYAFQNFYTLLTRVASVLVILILAAIIVRGLTEHVTVIQSLSVPKSLADGGYTPEVAGQRLRDALQEYVKSTNTHMRSPDVALHGELPDIVVPSVGISLDAIMTSIRTMLRSTRSRAIGGEFTIIHDKLWLRLRLDGREIYANDKGVDISDPDSLLADAAPKVLDEIQPYFLAAALSIRDPDGALAKADDIIAKLPETDANVAWSYNLKGSLLQQRDKLDAAVEALNAAIRIDRYLAVAYINLGNVLKAQGKLDAAMEQYHLAIALDPAYAPAHYNLGVTLRDLHKTDEAIREYREAVKCNPGDALAHEYLGTALRSQENYPEAIVELTKATKLDPKNAIVHLSLAKTLRDARRWDDAIAEFGAAIKADQALAAAHYGLADTLREERKVDEAIVEFKAAIAVQPNYVPAHNDLGAIYIGLDQRDAAIGEFNAVLNAEPKNSVARRFLKELGVDVPPVDDTSAEEPPKATEFSSKMQFAK